jgi:catechol 2,3-dioxygenase-like lactoylglutathione lyase family enzyme
LFSSIITVAVYVTDLERARKFYTDTLGFEVAADIPPNLCFLKSLSGKINIYLEGGKKPSSSDSETCRLSFFLQGEKSASFIHSHLKSKGVRVLQDAPEFVGDDTYCFQFEDPDGNILEVAAGP